MERLLHYVWKYRLYEASSLTTTDGSPLSVLDPGLHNTDAGPDFFNAKIKINDTIWVGNVEMHRKASDWIRHNHPADKAYDSVVLHVVGEDDIVISRTNGETIPQVVLTIPSSLLENVDWLMERETDIPCLPSLGKLDESLLAMWLDYLRMERLERKTNDVFTLLKQSGNDWNEVFYVTLTRSFGFGLNSDAFERLAKSLPFNYILKHRNNYWQIEALLFGQAGMLEYPGKCPYYKMLQREYSFLKGKFKLKPLDSSIFRSLRVRPGNFPHQRLAQLAAIWCLHGTLFSVLLESDDLEHMKGCFRIPPSDYWKTHYHFRDISPEKIKIPGEDTLHLLLINTVVPLFFAYGQYHDMPHFCDKANHFLEKLSPEKNRIIHTFRQAGVKVRHAGDSQALIQLKRDYCEKKKCLYCRIGFRLMKRDTVQSY